MNRFFLPLCIFLLSGYIQREAYASAGYDHAASEVSSEKPDHVNFVTQQNRLALFPRSASSHGKKQYFKIDVTEVREEEEDEHEQASIKKYFASSHYFLSALFTQAPSHFSSTNKGVSPFYRRHSYTASNRYLMFLVIRI
ncbi:hypothetical protein [Ohtaekwangia koreensis]|uniref:hypothetical protein n=1 Tax=Ohtaekwangia koreensis TaxID=688867 RepID=UPI001C8777F5|nr:hypothetical protein [Ohtaekwangia koreensis]